MKKNPSLNEGICMSSTRQGRVSAFSALAVLALLIAGANLVGYSVANPYKRTGEVPPDQETYPPVITVTSPVNNTAYNTSRVLLTFNVTALQSRTAWGPVILMSVTYKADWYKEAINVLNGGGQQQASFSLQFSNVPEGQHSIVIKAVGYGRYKQENDIFYKVFRISSTATVSFTIDCTRQLFWFCRPKTCPRLRRFHLTSRLTKPTQKSPTA